ncbi:SCO family protein [Massilia sp. DWR3-1-1]|uniref:SCO family protein n=1 Tax=Massilia sp. DWR3-1-1 TaxID=2804559 RepID=UPI003CF091AA
MQASPSKIPNPDEQRRRGRWKLLAVLAVCAAPLIFSYLTYYVIKPTGRTNYGDLIDPRAHPMPQLGTSSLDGKSVELGAYQGKWLMLVASPSACPKACLDQMYAIRQVRAMQGKEMERIERVWLITDQAPLDTMLIRELDGVRMLRARAAAVTAWLPPPQQAGAASPIYLVDPLGNLMMRFAPPPAGATEAQAVEHYARIKKDIAKLLKASAIG